jgi:WD40 repeat protein
MNGTVYHDPTPVQGRGSRELRPSGPNWWLIGIAVVLVLGALYVAYLVFHSNEPRPEQVTVAGTSNRSLAISADGKLLASGGLDGYLRVFAVADAKVVALTQLPTAVMAVTFGPGDTILVLSQNDSHLHIYSRDLTAHTEREVQPHPHDLAWSSMLDGAVVISGGVDEVHPKLELFPAHPMGIAESTVQLFDLRAWHLPRSVGVTSDGSRIGIAFATAGRNNLIFYDPKKRHIAGLFSVEGTPQSLAFSQHEDRLWVTSPSAESITEIAPRTTSRTPYPKGASTSPPLMIAVNEATRRAYTSGSLTFPEVDLDQNRIVRTVELPFRSAAIVLSPDGKTAYLSSEAENRIAVVDLESMKYLRDISWKNPQK